MTAQNGIRIAERSRAFAATIVLAALAVLLVPFICAQSPASSQGIADSAMQRWPVEKPRDAAQDEPIEPGLPIFLTALDEEWLGTANAKYFQYVQSSIDGLIGPDGSMQAGGDKSSNLDNIPLGRELLHLYRVTLHPEYFKAAQILHSRLAAQSRSAASDFRHASSDSGTMRVEDLYSAEPFYAEYASTFQERPDFNDIASQFSVFERRARDAKTGLLSSGRVGAGKQAPLPELNDTALYMMALVDTLAWFPANEPSRATLLDLLRRTTESAVRSEKEDRGQSNDLQRGRSADRPSTFCMLAYALAKAVRLGYLPQRDSALASRAYDLAASSLNQAAPGDDRATTGEFLLASREMEVALLARAGRGDKVMLDAWFNAQQRKNALGEAEYFHYKWDDNSDSGFSLLGHLFNDYGIETDTLYAAPTLENLSSARFYIVVSPDIPSKNPSPNYVTKRDAAQVAEWVKQGGILLMMENDPGNADIEHLDVLADIFGIHFNNVLSHHVIGDTFSMGRIEAPADGELLKQPLVLYMKDTCTITLSSAARPLLVDKGDVMMATAKYGKGTVFAVVDPWLYNEYSDGRKLPPEYGNFKGAQALLDWLVSRLPQPKSRIRR
jgi:unsaturated rhamnogalacturonyl hydrolase